MVPGVEAELPLCGLVLDILRGDDFWTLANCVTLLGAQYYLLRLSMPRPTLNAWTTVRLRFDGGAVAKCLNLIRTTIRSNFFTKKTAQPSKKSS